MVIELVLLVLVVEIEARCVGLAPKKLGIFEVSALEATHLSLAIYTIDKWPNRSLNHQFHSWARLFHRNPSETKQTECFFIRVRIGLADVPKIIHW